MKHKYFVDNNDDDDDDDNAIVVVVVVVVVVNVVVVEFSAYDADLDILETMSLQRIRENKQFLKIAAKCDKDLDLLRRKHEKVNETTEQSRR